MYVGTSTPGPDQPDAFLQWQARHDLSSSSKKEKDEHIPISQRKWEHISSVDKLLASRFPISIGMTHLLRPRRDLRDQDGAVPWEFFTSKFEGFRSKVAAWTIKDWKIGLLNGTDDIRSEYCLDQHGPKLQNNVQIRYGWTDFIYHVGSAWDSSSISEGGLIAGRIATQSGKQTCIFTAVNPVKHLSHSMLSPRSGEGKPRMLPDKLRWRRAHDANYWFGWKLAWDKGLVVLANISKCHQTKRLHASRLLGQSGAKNSIRD